MATKSSTKNKSTLTGTSVADTLTVKHTQVTVNAGKGNDKINVNSGSSHKIYGEAGNDTIVIAAKAGSGLKVYGDDASNKLTGNDTFTINGGKKNYFYGGKGVDTFNVNGGSTNYIYGGEGNDVIVIGKTSTGTAVVKDFSVSKGNTDIVKVAGGAVKSIAVSGNDMIIKGGKSASVTLQNAKAKTFTVTDILGNYTVDVAKVKLALGKTYKGTLNAASFLTTVDARSDANAITINGNAKNNTIYGGAGNNVLNGGAGNDTVSGGAGKDTFVYANGQGKDTISDYTAGQDTLQISSGAISKTALSNKDLVFTVGSGSITLKNAATEAISLKDNRGDYTASGTAITLASNFTGTMDASKYLASVKTIDGRNAVKAVNITGNAQNNTIYSGKAGGTIKGGAGDDALYGGAGKDTFVYASGDGNDTITGYASGQDALQISNGSVSNMELANNNKDLVFTVGDGSVTVKDAAAKSIRMQDSRGSYTVTRRTIKLGSDFTGTLDAADVMPTVTTINGEAATGNTEIKVNGSNRNIYGGMGQDQLSAEGNYNTLYGGAGDDTLEVKGTGNYLSGDEGNDEYIVNWPLREEHNSGEEYHTVTIDNAFADESDSDTLVINGADSSNFTFSLSADDARNLVIREDASGDYVVVYDWVNHGFESVTFDDKAFTNEEIREIIAEASRTKIDWYLSDTVALDASEIGTGLQINGYKENDFVVTLDSNGQLVMRDAQGGTLTISNWNENTLEAVAFVADGYKKVCTAEEFSDGIFTSIALANEEGQQLAYNSGSDVSEEFDIDLNPTTNIRITANSGAEDRIRFIDHSASGFSFEVENNNLYIQDYNNNEATGGQVIVENYKENSVKTIEFNDVVYHLIVGNASITGNSKTFSDRYVILDNDWKKDAPVTDPWEIVVDGVSGNAALDFRLLPNNERYYSLSHKADGRDMVLTYTYSVNRHDGATLGSIRLKDYYNADGSVNTENGYPRIRMNRQSYEGHTSSDAWDSWVWQSDRSYRFLSLNSGTSGNDTADLSELDQTVNTKWLYFAGDGDDTITAREGDIVYGETGNDTLNATGSLSDIHGGSGNDTITVQGANGENLNHVVVRGGSDDDVITAYGSYHYLNGGAGNDKIHIRSAEGSNEISAFNAVSGSAGDDEIYIHGADDNRVNGGAGTDYLSVIGNRNVLNGDDGDDTLEVVSGNGNILIGGAGNDIFAFGEASNGNTIIRDYEESKDVIQISGGSITATDNLSDGSIKFTVGEGSIVVADGTDKVISLKDNRGSYTVSDTTIELGSDFSGAMDANAYQSTVTKVDGTKTEDAVTITGNEQANIISAGNAGGTIDGGAGDDRLTGGAGKDILFGGAGKDTLIGGADDDALSGGAGNDVLTGGAGKDTFVYADGDGNDIITDYEAGQDTLQISNGSVSNTELANNNKDLVFTVGDGTVTLTDAANKTVSLQDERGSYTVSGTAITLGADFTGTMDTTEILPTVTTINGEAATGNTIIKGNGNNKELSGGAGNDNLSAEGSSNTLSGGTGNDTLSAEGNSNKLYGGAGNDTLEVVRGLDNFLYGDEGSDRYIVNWPLREEPNGVDECHNVTIDNATASASDNDTLVIKGADSSRFKFYLSVGDDRDLVIQDNASGDYVVVYDWSNHGFESVTFDDKAFTNAEIRELLFSSGETMLIEGNGTYEAEPGSNNIFTFSSSGWDAVITGTSSKDCLDFSQYTDGDYGTNMSQSDNDLVISFVKYEGNTETPTGRVTIKDYFAQSDKISRIKRYNYAAQAVQSATFIAGGNNNTNVNGTSEADWIITGNGNKTVDAGGGNDLIQVGWGDAGAEGIQKIHAGAGSDEIYADGGKNVLNGDDGDDFIFVENTTDNELNGGDGNDILETYGSGHELNGDAGNDTLKATGMDNGLFGGVGNDTLEVTGDENYLYGGDGSDVLTIHGGNSNSLSGGSDSDTYVIDTELAADTSIDIDNYGNGEADILQLTKVNKADVTYSFENDVLIINHKNGGLISVYGWRQNSLAEIQFANGESITGEAINNDLGLLVWNGTDGADNQTIACDNSVLNGKAGDDTLVVTGDYNYLYGGEGADTLKVSGDYNEINGDAGNDTLEINGNSNHLYGNAGNDTLEMAGNYNYLTGGTGSDTYVINQVFNEDTRFYLEQYSYEDGDADILQLTNVDKADVDYIFENETLTISHTSGGRIDISSWVDNPLAEIQFADGTSITGEEINNILGLHIWNGTDAADNQTVAWNNGVLNGRDGDDILKVTGDNNRINGAAGSDNLEATGESNNLIGGKGADTLKAEGDNNDLWGDDDNDTLEVNGDNNNLYGGKGDDTLTINGGNHNTLNGGSGSDRYVVNTAFAADTNITIWQKSSKDVIDSDVLQLTQVNKNDITYSLQGDALRITHKTGGVINVENWYSSPFERIQFAGEETVTSEEVKEVLGIHEWNGTEEDDDQDVVWNNSKLNGAAGNDHLRITGNNSRLYGGEGTDTLEATGDDNKLYGNDGADTLQVNGSNNYLYGGTGSDTYVVNSVFTNDTNITIYQYDGSDEETDVLQLTNVSKNDIASYKVENGTLTITHASGGKVTVEDWEYSPLSEIQFAGGETISYVEINNSLGIGTKGDDTIVFDGDDYSIYGYEGNDNLSVIGDRNYLYGDDGEDELDAHGDDNYLLGYNDNDTLTATGNGNSLYGDLGNDTLEVNGNENFLYGEDDDDTLTATGTGNYLDGGAGNDTLEVNSDGNSLYGGEDTDSLKATGNGNSLYGGDGDDTLTINDGNNYFMSGDAGSDTYVVNTVFTEDTNITINQSEYKNGDTDVLLLTQVYKNEVIYSLSGNTLVITHNSGGVINVQNWDENALAEVQFIEGEPITAAEINERLGVWVGTNGDDELTATKDGKSFFGIAGSDSVSVTGNNNYLDGGKGEDILIVNGDSNSLIGDADNDMLEVNGDSNFLDGVAGNDTLQVTGNYNNLYGGYGNDIITVNGGTTNTLDGSYGNDTYIINANFTKDTNITINQYGIEDEDVDTLRLVTASKDDIASYTLIDGTLTITHVSGGMITVDGWNENPLSKVIFADNTELTGEEVNALATVYNSVVTVNESKTYAASGTGTVFQVTGTGYDAVLTGTSCLDMLDLSQYTDGEYGCNMSQSGNDLVIEVAEYTGDQVEEQAHVGTVTLKDYFTTDDRLTNLRRCEYEDGSVVDVVDVKLIVGGNYNVDVSGTDGIDFIITGNGNKSVNAGAGNDYIQVGWGDAGSEGTQIINAGAGDDEISADGGQNTLNGEAGNDDIFVENTTNNTLNGGDGNDRLEAYGSGHTLNGGENDDVIISHADNSTLNGGSGNDEIVVGYGKYQIVDGGAGNDTIEIYNSFGHNISGGAGSDRFVFDTHLGSENIVTFDQSSVNAGDTDVLELKNYNKGDISSYSLQNGVMTLETTAGGKFVIQGWDMNPLAQIQFADSQVMTGDDINGSLVTPEVVTQQSVMKSFMKSLDDSNVIVESAENALDTAVSTASNNVFTSWNGLVQGFVNDVRNFGATTIEQAKDFLVTYCGINLDNDDTGAITGADAGGEVEKTAISIVPEVGTMADAIAPTGTETAINGLTLEWPSEELNEKQQVIVKAINTWWVKEGLDLVEESYGLSFTEQGTTVSKMNIEFYTDSESSTLAAVYNSHYTSGPNIGEAVSLTMRINMAKFESIDLDDVNGYAGETSGYLDRTIAHELTHAVMAANITGFNQLPDSIVEGSAELVHGIDDFRTSNIMALALSSNSEDLSTALTNNQSLSHTLYENSYAAGYMLLRYFAKQVADSVNDNTSTSSSPMLANFSNDALYTFSSVSGTAVNDASLTNTEYGSGTLFVASCDYTTGGVANVIPSDSDKKGMRLA